MLSTAYPPSVFRVRVRTGSAYYYYYYYVIDDKFARAHIHTRRNERNGKYDLKLRAAGYNVCPVYGFFPLLLTRRPSSFSKFRPFRAAYFRSSATVFHRRRLTFHTVSVKRGRRITSVEAFRDHVRPGGLLHSSISGPDWPFREPRRGQQSVSNNCQNQKTTLVSDNCFKRNGQGGLSPKSVVSPWYSNVFKYEARGQWRTNG